MKKWDADSGKEQSKDLLANNLSCVLTRGYRVVPLWAHQVSLQIEHPHLGGAHADTCSVGRASQASAYLQTSLRYGCADKAQQ